MEDIKQNIIHYTSEYSLDIQIPALLSKYTNKFSTYSIFSALVHTHVCMSVYYCVFVHAM